MHPRRRDVLRWMAIAPAVVACARAAPDGDVAAWLAAAIYGEAPPDEITALRARIAERAALPAGAALAAALGPPATPIDRWEPRVWRDIAEVLRRHVAGSATFRSWAGLPARGRACAGLVPWGTA